jgi:hypothetical protein
MELNQNLKHQGFKHLVIGICFVFRYSDFVLISG